MIEKWKIFYTQMIDDIEVCLKKDMFEQEQAGCSYKIALHSWLQVKAETKKYEFKFDLEEIYFYKNIKPKFTGYIEYIMLINNGLLFIPTESKEEQIYWQFEVERLTRFRLRNKGFVEYYESGNTLNDHQYFLHLDKSMVHKPSKVYDVGGEVMSSHDNLVASLIAEERYHEFAMEKLQECNKSE